MKIYIAGSITNNPDYKERFKAAEDFIKATGHEPWNPVKPEGSSYKFYIDSGLQELSRCDAIFMLKGWEKSKGASLEFKYAFTVGLAIFYENTPYIKEALENLAREEKN